MIQFSEDYNAQTIFDQVWEAPYSWFALPRTTIAPHILPSDVNEMDDWGNIVESYPITAEMIEDAVWKLFKEVVSKRTGNRATNFADWVSDLDADDVDSILQMAVFGEIRYG